MRASYTPQDAIRDAEVDELEEIWRGSPGGDQPSAAFTDATLTITRNAPDDVQDRTVNLWLDGQRWEPLRYGATLTRTIAPGRHRLKAHNTLFGTEIEFDARPGENVRIKCSNAMTGSGMLLMILIGWAMLRVRLEREA